ncbi:hypothetical protein CEXT_352961, partial [Caerostris extrusa]
MSSMSIRSDIKEDGSKAIRTTNVRTALTSS